MKEGDRIEMVERRRMGITFQIARKGDRGFYRGRAKGYHRNVPCAYLELDKRKGEYFVFPEGHYKPLSKEEGGQK